MMEVGILVMWMMGKEIDLEAVWSQERKRRCWPYVAFRSCRAILSDPGVALDEKVTKELET